MPDVNITVCGTATRDPELRYTAGGRGVASFGVAVNDRYFDKTADKWVDGEASFFNVTAWGALGENAAQSVTKGTRVVVTGKMKQRSWETDEGEKRTVWDLVADDLGPSLKWANAEVVKTERTKAAPNEEQHAPGEEPF